MLPALAPPIRAAATRTPPRIRVTGWVARRRRCRPRVSPASSGIGAGADASSRAGSAPGGGSLEYGTDPDQVERIATPGPRRSRETRRAGSRRHRRRQHLSRLQAPPRDGAFDGRLHGHAGDGHQRAGAPGEPGTARASTRACDCHHHGGGRRAVHPPPGHPAPREGPRRDLRRWHWQPVLHHRHRGCSARAGDPAPTSS